MINCSPKDRYKLGMLDIAIAGVIYISVGISLLLIFDILDMIFKSNLGGQDLEEPIARVISLIIYPTFQEMFFVNGSAGSKILKYKVINLNDEKRPSNAKMFIRGLITAIFPAHALFARLRLDYRTLPDLIQKPELFTYRKRRKTILADYLIKKM